MYLAMGFTHIEGGPIAHRVKYDDDTFVVGLPGGKVVPALSDDAYDYVSQYLTAWYRFLQENNWLDRTVQHIADEPLEKNKREYRILAGIVRKFMPGIPTFEAIETTDLDGAIDIWIPKPPYYVKNTEAFDRKRKNGDRVWFYTCTDPGGTYVNRFLDGALIRTRLIHTANYRYHFEGYLHWGFNCYHAGNGDPFNTANLIHPAGDSHIVYPGSEGPWGSVRLEMMRCGIEDYELLTLLAQKNKPLADKIAENWLPAFNKPNEDVDAFAAGREELLQALDR